jgi:hypothetical protein
LYGLPSPLPNESCSSLHPSGAWQPGGAGLEISPHNDYIGFARFEDNACRAVSGRPQPDVFRLSLYSI